MFIPILAYGHPNLRKISVEIEKDYPGLNDLIDNMFESMYESNGVGLAAPQINKQIRLFVIDATPYSKEIEAKYIGKKVFINAHIIEETGEEWPFEEGCLSIPGINEDVYRKPKLRIQYFDRDWNYFDEEIEGLFARIIQHEYDHLEGVLFTDRLSPLKKTVLRGKLSDITKGKTNADYRMIFAPTTKKRRM